MRRKALVIRNFSGHDAANALHVLIADGKLAARDVVAALKRREGMIRELRNRLTRLEAGIVGRVRAIRGNAAVKVRRKRKLSPATRAKYRQQGLYLAALRRLSMAQRARVKAVRKKSGVRSAVAVAKKLAR